MSNENARTTMHEDPADLLFREPADHRGGGITQRTIHVEWHDGVLGFTLYHTMLDPEDMGTTQIGDAASIQGTLVEIGGLLEKASARKYLTEAGVLSQRLNLQGLGAALFEAVIPDALAEDIRKWPDTSWVAVSSNEEWVPWELLHDGQGFLGVRFRLFRLPRIRHHARSPRLSRSARQLRGKCVRSPIVIHVIGGGLKEPLVCACQRLFVDVHSGVQVHLLLTKLLRDVVDQLKDADLVHFTCHGHREPLRLQVSQDDDPTVALTVRSLRSSEIAMKAGCIVFANACSSATVHSQLGGFLSFGWEFYAKGASTFIGTLGAVPTEAAIEFAESFYKALGADRNGDVFGAYCTVKEGAGLDRLMTLLYCFYGNPIVIPSLILGKECGHVGEGPCDCVRPD